MRSSVVLNLPPPDTSAMLRILRLLGNLELREAKAIAVYAAAHVPCALVEGIDTAQAERLAEQLNAAGGNAVAAPSDASHPMMLWPEASVERTQSFWRGLVEKS